MQEFIDRNKVSLALVTETWLKSALEDTFVDIPGFSIVQRDQASNAHGGVCFYIKDDYLRFKKLEELTCCKDHAFATKPPPERFFVPHCGSCLPPSLDQRRKRFYAR